MKKCNEQKIWDYIDGELIASEIDQIREHFKHCPKCLHEFELNLSLHKEIKKIDCMKPSVRFGKNVMEAIEMDVTSQFKPLLNAFWKRICLGGIGTFSFYAIIIALLYPGVVTQSLSPANLLNHPAAATVFFIIITGWILYFVDQWMQKKWTPGNN